MDKLKSLKTLEYFDIIEMLEEQAVSTGAKKVVKNILPMTDIEDVLSAIEKTTDAKNMMVTKASPSFSAVHDVTASVKRAEMSGTLSLSELLKIAGLLKSSRNALKYFEEDETEENSLSPMFARLMPNRYLEEKITNAIISEEEVADGASSELSTLRRKKRVLENRVRETLNKFISSQSHSKYLQDTIVTMRGDRYVIPVKSEHRSDVPGLVHDVSSSGATVFIEPTAVVNAGNELRLIEAEEKNEISRILREFSAEIASFSEGIIENYEALCLLDVIFAKAKLSFKLNCALPIIKDDGHTKIIRGRHPLLDMKIAVPIDIEIGGEYNTLVVTGPNTGGKTVSLKTLGLICLMAASGLHVPCDESSEVSIYQNVFADIGDEQSIEQSLSTFSSHMTNIVKIVEVCTKGDLVLFDELGAGTDPIEGAALAISIIEFCRKMGACVGATTHYAELKAYALTTNGVENASCQFDVSTLRPTYKLITGIPGKSNAFAISKRLGLDDGIIERAKEHISHENAKFEDLIETLERERRQFEKYKEEAEHLKRRAQSEKDKASDISRKTETEQEKIISKAQDQAERILKDARQTAQTVFSKLDDIKKTSAKDIKEQNLKAARNELYRSIDGAENEVYKAKRKKTNENTSALSALAVGDEVHLLNYGSVVGSVIKPADKDGNIVVQAGILKVTVKISEVNRVKLPEKPKNRTFKTAAMDDLYRANAKTEVDIRGMNVEEGLMEVDQFISGALMARLDFATIIHGKGTGVLRAAVQQHLKSHPRIKSQRPGKFGEGEQGVTIIEFK